MNKIIITILILVTVSCQKKEKRIDFKSELKGKMFTIVNNGNSQADFEFRDSTYTLFQLMKFERSYDIKEKNGITYISLGKFICTIEKSTNDAYDFLIYDIESNDSLFLKEKNPRWNSDKIYGNWIEENLSQTELNSVPFYSINANEINYYKNGKKIKSEIIINKTNEYVEMNLIHTPKRVDIVWRIKSISDSTMLIDRISKTDSLNQGTRYNLKLLKKR